MPAASHTRLCCFNPTPADAEACDRDCRARRAETSALSSAGSNRFGHLAQIPVRSVQIPARVSLVSNGIFWDYLWAFVCV